MLVDSHAHLDSPEFDKDAAKLIQGSNLDYILNVSTDINSLEKSAQLAHQYESIYFSGGIHPHYAAEADFVEFRKYLCDPKLKAIGETGLDFYRDLSPRDKQEDLFKKCLNEAQNHKLPVIIHQRNAQKEVLSILKTFSVSGGVMHCFSGDVEYMRECIDLGFYISFAGNITYPKAGNLREVVKETPLDRLLIETDCPWLAPQSMRGKRNEPGFVKYVADEIARIKKISTEEVGNITGNNFRTLFKI